MRRSNPHALLADAVQVAPPAPFAIATGIVKWFNDARGYGFISRATDGADVFVHYSEIAGEAFRTLEQGQRVTYEERQGSRGLFASKVTKLR